MSSMFVGGSKSVQSIRPVFLSVLFLSAISISGTSVRAQSDLPNSIADTIQPLLKGYQGDVVVLNAANSDARYVDARNLHALGWRKSR